MSNEEVAVADCHSYKRLQSTACCAVDPNELIKHYSRLGLPPFDILRFLVRYSAVQNILAIASQSHTTCAQEA